MEIESRKQRKIGKLGGLVKRSRGVFVGENSFIQKKPGWWVWEVAQWLKELAVLAEDQSLDPSPDVGWPMAACSSTPGGSHDFFWSLCALYSYTEIKINIK